MFHFFAFVVRLKLPLDFKFLLLPHFFRRHNVRGNICGGKAGEWPLKAKNEGEADKLIRDLFGANR